MRQGRMRGGVGHEAGWPGESGSVLLIALMFTIVFLGMGLALFYLVMSSIRGTETEAREVKSFNVAEAGVDAGMLELYHEWPVTASLVPAVDETALRADFDPDDFPDPRRSPASDFIDIEFRDNTSSVYDPNAPTYDSNRDNLMYVSSEANVDDDRHRIIVLAQRQIYKLDFPFIAMYTSAFDANGRGLEVYIDPLQTEPLPALNGTAVPAFYNTQIGRNPLSLGTSVIANPSDPGTFSNWVDAALMAMLRSIATTNNTFFTDGTAANNFLLSADAPGSIVYLDTTSAVIIGGMTPIGSRTDPVVLAIDAHGQNVGLDFRGTADFYGIIVVNGNPTIRGTASIYGSFIASGTLVNLGTGANPEINYNGNLIKKINQGYTVSVNVLPNSWEEYTTPR